MNKNKEVAERDPEECDKIHLPLLQDVLNLRN